MFCFLTMILDADISCLFFSLSLKEIKFSLKTQGIFMESKSACLFGFGGVRYYISIIH